MQAAGTGTLYIIVVHMYLISLDRYSCEFKHSYVDRIVLMISFYQRTL